MNEQIREQLSAYMDGELPAVERAMLLRRLGADPELQAWWERQHRVRDVLRNDAAVFELDGLAARVRDAVDAEAALPVAVGSGVARPAAAGWWRPLAGLAVAASVATVAVLGVRGYQVEPGSPGTTVAGLDTRLGENLGDGAETPLWSRVGVARDGITTVSTSGTRDPRFEAYLASHAEQAMMLGSAGWIPYSRMVGQGDGDVSPRIRAGER